MTRLFVVPALALGICLSCTPAQEITAPDPAIPADKDPQTTSTGLVHSTLAAPADGAAKAEPGCAVIANYQAWLPSGALFDSSQKRGRPERFVVGKISVEGLNEGLQLTAKGGRYKLTLPAALAFGEAGRPPVIPANSPLVFDIEVLDVIAPPAFPKGDEPAQKKTESGLVYEILTAGAGESPGKDDIVEMRYAFWNQGGELLECSEWNDVTISGRLDDFRLPFLKEAPLLMKVGAVYRFIVPAALGFGEQGGPSLEKGTPTIWKLTLVKFAPPPKMPDFAMPADDKLTTTASGLKYEVIEAGEGESPVMGQAVKVHYAGWLPDGTLFDASYNSGQPATFRLGEVIGGWNEGLQLMKPGAKFRLVIPPDLAYGAAGSPPKIGPNATLVFHVHLIELPR